MAEWLILVLLVPAIVLPAVLLLGFAGCGIDRGGRARPMPPPPPPPMVPGVTIVSARAWPVRYSTEPDLLETSLQNEFQNHHLLRRLPRRTPIRACDEQRPTSIKLAGLTLMASKVPPCRLSSLPKRLGLLFAPERRPNPLAALRGVLSNA